MCPHPTHEDHDFNKLESTLSKDVSTQFTAFLGEGLLRKWFLKKDFFKIPV